jgi:ParB family chromosome partitioning protein
MEYKYSVHPVTACWPMMAPDEMAELIADIKIKGLQDPIILIGDVLLDGRNRLKACQEAGIEPQFIQYEGDDPAGYIISTNQRRNLTLGQRAMVAEKLAGLKDGQRADRQGSSKELAILSQEQAAAASGTSVASLKRAREIRTIDPELAKKVESGDMTLGAAHETAKPHVAHSSGDNEWYTPKKLAESAHKVMGEITLDPASTLEANKIVKAKDIFTAEDDGLKQNWAGKLWMNPPYESALIGKFAEKLASSIESGKVIEALVLVNNATETRWFARLCSVASGLCFPTGRVKFWHPHKEKQAVPLQGQAVLYIGNQYNKFIEEFGQYGIVAKIEQ